MTHRDLAALDGYQLLPRLLHDVVDVDTHSELMGRALSSPLVPVVRGASPGAPRAAPLALVDADGVLANPDRSAAAATVALLPPVGMGELIGRVRKLVALDVAGFALDLTLLAATPPYGARGWHPRHRDDLAELRAAAGRPLWLYGVCSAADAEMATEAALEGVVVHSGVAAHLGGPATIEVLPEVIDAAAGMIGIFAGGTVRSGIDAFRYLAVGAEAVLVESDRALPSLEAELHYAMRLTGCASLVDIGYEALFAPLFGEG